MKNKWWNKYDKKSEPLTEEMFRKFWIDFNEKESYVDYISLIKKPTILEKIFKSLWNITKNKYFNLIERRKK
jgi:alpha-glucosidase (family GH31 glycosyl hydrolase)